MQPAEFGVGRLFEAIRDAVVISDERGRILLWNPGAETVFGWPASEAVGRNVAMLVPERLKARHLTGISHYARTGHGPLIDGTTPIELPALTRSGKEIVVELSLSGYDREGQRHAVAIIRDVTERASLRASLEARTASLVAANESLRAFSYVVSHDLKEPVRALETYLEVLVEDHRAQMPPEAAELLDAALGSAHRLAALLGGLLELSRIDRADLIPQAVGVEAVARGEVCRVTYEDLFRERGASLVFEGGGTQVFAPPSLFCQALSNLLLNAVKHNPSPRPQVRVRAHPHEAPGEEGRLICILVEDNGPGFPPAMLEADRAPGRVPMTLRAGFGLLITRRAVERMGGRLWLGRSEDLGGAAVSFTVPAAPPSGPAGGA